MSRLRPADTRVTGVDDRRNPERLGPTSPASEKLEDMNPQDRIAGILVPVFSLRADGDQGIGDTEALIEFIDWAAGHGFSLVKTLPVNETGADNSPYNA